MRAVADAKSGLVRSLMVAALNPDPPTEDRASRESDDREATTCLR